MRESGHGEEALRRLAEEAEQEEAERLAKHIGKQAMTDISPTLQVEANWNQVRWDIEPPYYGD